MSVPSRPVSGFVPLSDVAGAVELPGGRALTPAAPQARHHFTTLRQVNQLIEASEADADLGFMARLLALCSLPRTNPGDQKEYVRRNGPYALVMSAGGLNKLPFGTLPRLLLAWVCSEAVRLQSRELVLGRSLYEFMRRLGMSDRSGSVRGDRTRLKNQMRRLFACTVTLVYENAQREVRVSSLVADRTELREQLGRKQVETFLPTITRWSRWKDRRKKIAWPLFPGYCFARFDPKSPLPILRCTGVVSIVSFDGEPAPIAPRR